MTAADTVRADLLEQLRQAELALHVSDTEGARIKRDVIRARLARLDAAEQAREMRDGSSDDESE